MKRTKCFLLLGVLLSVFAGCIKETPFTDSVPKDNLPFPEGEKAVLRMSVNLPLEPGTRAMADQSQIENLRIVIFGSSGFLKESIDAEDIQYDSEHLVYTFTVKPSLTDSKNLKVHVIANCTTLFPWKYEDVVMGGSAYTTGNQDAYWCRFILPNGITPLKAYNAETDAMEYVKDGDFYKVTTEVENAFRNLPLIRNFAKFTVESTTPQLVLNPTTTMALINTPDRGSVAPYDPTRSLFMDHYKDSTYTQLKAHYPGYTPPNMAYVNTNPDAVTFHSGTTGIYMYERPKPSGSSDTPTYLIIHGIYYPLQNGKTATDLATAVTNAANATTQEQKDAILGAVVNYSSPHDGYYKIDLMDEDGYYAVLRNFRYHIRISSVSKEGASTPGQAGSTGGTGDISSSTEAAALTDISDGYGRIAVSFVEMTIVEQKAKVELKYKFIPSVDAGDVPNNTLSTEDEDGPVTITIGEKSGPVNVFSNTFDSSWSSTAGTEVGNTTSGKVKVINGNDAEGYRTIYFTTNAPSTTGKTTQTIRITGKIDQYKSIYREITFNLMEKQNMTVVCEADEPVTNKPLNSVEDIMGQGVNVNISIPILLPESMFPLVFNIESSELSITPNTAKYPSENLPVQGGTSIWKSGKQAFYYKKTLSYDEYKLLATNDNGTKTFTCHFKTNTANSASTVYVTNEYFNMGSGAFDNFTMYDFTNVRFSNPRAAANTNLNCTFNLDSEDSTRPRTITVVLDGLAPQTPNSNGWTALSPSTGEYSYSFTTNGSTAVTLALKTLTGTNYDGTYSVTLNADDYHEKERSTEDYQPVEVAATTANYDLPIYTMITGTGQRSGTATSNGKTFTLSIDNVRSRTNNSRISMEAESNITVSCSTLMTQIVITYYSSYGTLNYDGNLAHVETGSYTETNNNRTGTWTGSTNSVTIYYDQPSSYYTSFSGIRVTYATSTTTEYQLVND